MRTSCLYLVSALWFVGTTALAAPVLGRTCSFKVVDVDGRTVSATDGVVTVLVLASRRDVDKARLVGNRIPDRCLGSPKSRMITVVRFQPTKSSTVRSLLSGLIRRRLDAEAARLKRRYVAKNVPRDPRKDLYAVADFDGQIVTQLGIAPQTLGFRVLAISPNGILLRDWSDPPGTQELSAVLP